MITLLNKRTILQSKKMTFKVTLKLKRDKRIKTQMHMRDVKHQVINNAVSGKMFKS